MLREKNYHKLYRFINPLSVFRTAAASALANKKSLSSLTLAKIDNMKNNDDRPWVRLGAWKFYDLFQYRKELREKPKRELEKANDAFSNGNFFIAENSYRNASIYLEKVYPLDREKICPDKIHAGALHCQKTRNYWYPRLS